MSFNFSEEAAIHLCPAYLRHVETQGITGKGVFQCKSFANSHKPCSAEPHSRWWHSSLIRAAGAMRRTPDCVSQATCIDVHGPHLALHLHRTRHLQSASPEHFKLKHSFYPTYTRTLRIHAHPQAVRQIRHDPIRIRQHLRKPTLREVIWVTNGVESL